MNYWETFILNNLLDKYESSKKFQGTQTNRRILLKVSSDKKLMSSLESYEQRSAFFTELVKLKKLNLIDYFWVKGERDNIVKEIVLNTEPEPLSNSYALLNKPETKDTINSLLALLTKTKNEIKNLPEIAYFLEQSRLKISSQMKFTRHFTDDLELDRNLCKFLVELDHLPTEQTERLISTKLYNDSKYFEKELKSKVLSILRQVQKDNDLEVSDDASLLAQYGIVRYPQLFFFSGPIRIYLKNQGSVDYSCFAQSAIIDSKFIQQIETIDTSKIHKVLFIENKASYYQYLNHSHPDELVVYHGGCFSPIAKEFFKKIHDSASKISFSHWSDIDLGGFRIFVRLQNEIIPELQPYLMDVKTLLTYENKAIKITNQDYLTSLQNLLTDPYYRVFNKVIELMINKKIKLEQECIDLD